MKKFLLAILLWVLISDAFCAASYVRIVSLAPNLTEILYALGLEEQIAAVTSYCDFPTRVKSKPKIGGMSNPSLEAVVAIRPDMVVLTTDGNSPQFERKLQQLGIRTYVFRVTRIAELPQGIRDLGNALQVKSRAYALAEEIETAVASLRAKNGSKKGGKALFIVQTEPLMIAGPGTAIDDALHILGWTNIVVPPSGQYPRISLEEIITRSPDVIFMAKGSASMKEPSAALMKKIATVDSVRQKRVFTLGDSLFRMGPRIVDGIREMDACLPRMNR